MGGPPPGPDAVGARAAAAAQVFVDDPAAPVVSTDDRHHLLRVLRLRAGEVVVASDGRGRWCPCRFRGAGRGGAAAGAGAGAGDGALLEPDGPVVCEPAPAPALTVAFAPVKGDRPEWVVQKLTELGIDRVVPLVAERSVVRWEGERAERAVARLRRVAREAAAQCRRVWLPDVTGVRPVADLADLADVAGPAGIVGPAGAPGPAGSVALAQQGGGPPAAGTTTLAVGPEGGWAPGELAMGLPTVGLGPWVLRAETAAVAGASVMAALRDGTVVERNSQAARRGRRLDVGEST